MSKVRCIDRRETLRDEPDGVGKIIRSLRYYPGRAKEPRAR